jgi:hypothetical protein
MRPSAISFSTRRLFGADQPLLGLRGANSIERSASRARGLLSIQPKHSASSTAVS